MPDLFLAYPVPPAGPPGTHLPQRPGPVSELKEICRLKPGRQHPTGRGRPRTCLPGSQCSGEKAPVRAKEQAPGTQVSLGHTVIQSTTICIIHIGEQGQSTVQRGGDTLRRSHSMSSQSWVGAPGPQGLAQGSSTQPPAITTNTSWQQPNIRHLYTQRGAPCLHVSFHELSPLHRE